MLRRYLKYYYHKFYQKFHQDTFKKNMLLGKAQAGVNAQKDRIESLEVVEFQVFSQRGEDGILQYIISKLEIPNRIFIEFGVEHYTESNTRFLLINNNWRGLVMDGSALNIRFIKSDQIYWKYDITASQSFITKDNINDLILGYTDCRDIGLLSIDIDGNDYWVWKAIDCISPRIIVCEYNSIFGAEKKLTVPYAADFHRTRAHYSNLYFGASLPALYELAEEKGYDFIGTAGAGVNAFFVRKDLSTPFKKYTAQSGYRPSANRDSKDPNGKNNFLLHDERLAVIKDMTLVETSTGLVSTIKSLYNL